jgi:hypothetical protein
MSGSSATGGAVTGAGGSATTSTGSSAIGSGSGSNVSGATGAGTNTASAAVGGASGSAGGLADFTRRGGGNAGAAGLAGSGAFPPGFLPFAATGVSANDAFDGTLRPRVRAMRETNSRATTSSMVLDALFTSMP